MQSMRFRITVVDVESASNCINIILVLCFLLAFLKINSVQTYNAILFIAFLFGCIYHARRIF